MADRRRSAGLSIGQVFALTVGFLLASALIFFFGYWIGIDLTEQRLARERQVIRLPLMTPTALPEAVGALPPTPTRIAIGLAPTATPTYPLPTATAVPVARATPTRLGPLVSWLATPTHPRAAEAGTGWTVQVNATTDAVQAVMLARRLRAKGYDAYTVQGPIGGVNWYRVRVGRFTTREAAKAVETKLREQEKMEAAYVARQ
jgi:DedD protein